MEATLTQDGQLRVADRLFRAAFGRGGIRPHKEEGDGATPAGLLPLRRVFYRADRVAKPATSLPREPIADDDGWCDDPRHADYNRVIRLPHPARHERLWREDALYDVVAVLGWNYLPVIRHRGSAIFLHVAGPGLAPTDGCIALTLPDLQALLAMGLSAIYVHAN